MQSQKIEVDREFVEQTITDLAQTKELLIKERDAMTSRIDALTQRIQSLQVKLTQANSRMGSNGKKNRLRKGQGVAAIVEVLNRPDCLGVSQAQIAEMTDISGSSVYRILTKNPDKFVVGPDNLWRKKT